MPRLFIIFFSILLLMQETSFAGIYVEKQITTTISGKKINGLKKIYLAEDKALVVDPTLPSRSLYDFKNHIVYLINDTKRGLSCFSENSFIQPVNKEIYADFFPLVESDLYCKESGKKKKIGNYNCFELVIYIPKISAITKFWLSNKLKTSLELYFSFLEKNNMDIHIKKILPIMKKMNACIVESTTIIVRPKEPPRYLKIQLLKISNQDIPATLFALPEDYTKINLD